MISSSNSYNDIFLDRTHFKSISIEDFEKNKFNFKKSKINSPYSELALKKSGIKQNELNFISFKEYSNFHPESRNLSFNLKERRYKFFELLRKKKLNEVIALRKQLIQNGELSSTKSEINFNNSNILLNELKNIENIKKNNEKKLFELINNKINIVINHNKIYNRLLKQEEKDKKFQMEKELIKIEKENKQKLIEKEKKIQNEINKKKLMN